MTLAVGEDETPLPIFVYGTLRPGGEGFHELRLAGRVEHLGQDRVAGLLYDLGDYPGIIPGGDTPVLGDLLLPLTADVLPALDAFELYDPKDVRGSEYIRERILTLDGHRPAWIYAFNHSITGHPLIASGDWLTGRRA